MLAFRTQQDHEREARKASTAQGRLRTAQERQVKCNKDKYNARKRNKQKQS